MPTISLTYLNLNTNPLVLFTKPFKHFLTPGPYTLKADSIESHSFIKLPSKSYCKIGLGILKHSSRFICGTLVLDT